VTCLKKGVTIDIIKLVLDIRIKALNFIKAIVEGVVGGLVAHYF
jgi:hypothetical protein